MGDLISRQAAIDAVERNACNTQRAIDAINGLPSAQPEPCEDAVSRKAVQYLLAHFVNEDKYNDACDGLKHLPSVTPKQAEPCEDAVSRQAAIDHWRDIIDATDESDKYNMGFVDGLEFCISHLSTMPSAQPEQRWIPCSERLPEQYGNYLVSYRTDDFESDIGTFDPDRINSDTGEWSACDANGFYWVASKGLEVIAWMPLPEPYKEGEQNV